VYPSVVVVIFLLNDQQDKQRNDSKCENNCRITGKQRQNKTIKVVSKKGKNNGKNANFPSPLPN